MQSDFFDVLRQANDMLLKREPKEARKILDTIDKANDVNGASAFLYGHSYFQEGAYEDANDYYTKALQSGLIYGQLFLNLGVVREQLNDPTGAEAMYRQAAELEPSKADALDRIIALRLRFGNTDGAEQIMDELMLRNPELYDGFHHKAMLLLTADRETEALRLLYGVAERFSSHPLYVYDLCRILAHMDHSEDALEFLLEKENVFSNIFYRQMFIKEKASLLVKLGRFNEAEPLWNELYSDYGDRQAGVALISAAMQREDIENVLRLTDEILDTDIKDGIYYLCLYAKVLVLKAQNSKFAWNTLQKAAAEFEVMDENNSGMSLCVLRAVVLSMAGRKEISAADLDSVEKTLRETENFDTKNELRNQFFKLHDSIL